MFKAYWPAGSMIVCALVLGASPAAAAPSLKLSNASGHPGISTVVSGSGFAPSEAVDVYFDLTDELLLVTDSSGNISKNSLNVPLNALPGSHWITAVGRGAGDAAQASFKIITNWSEVGFNLKGKRYNAWENVISPSNVNQLDVSWATPVFDSGLTSPAYNGTVYVSGWDTTFAFNATTGAQLWAVATDSSLSSPTIANGTVYVGSDDEGVFALNASTGAQIWNAGIGGGNQVYSSPAVSNGLVYVGCYDGKLYALNATTGAVAWTATTGSSISTSSPAVANGMVFIGSLDHDVHAYNATTGASLWAAATGGYVYSSPAYANGLVYVGSNDGKVYAIRATSGTVAWTYTIGGPISSAPAVANGVVYIGAGSLYALNAKTGSLLWFANPGAGTNSSPAVANGVVYATTVDGQIDAFNATTGASLWAGFTGGGLSSSPSIADGMLFVGGNDGYMYSYTLNAGNNATYRHDPKPPSPASLRPDFRLKVVH